MVPPRRQKSRASVLFTASVLSHRPYTVSVLFFLLVRAERRTTNFSAQNRQRAKKKKRAEKRAKIIEQQIRRGLAINDSSGLETKLFFFLFFFSGGRVTQKKKKVARVLFLFDFLGAVSYFVCRASIALEGTSVSLTERRRKVLASFFFSAYSFLASSFYSRLQPVGALHGSFGWGICLGGLFFLFYPFFFSCCRENFPGCFLFWRCGYFVNSFSFYPWYVLLFFFFFLPFHSPPLLICPSGLCPIGVSPPLRSNPSAFAAFPFPFPFFLSLARMTYPMGEGP